MRKYCVTVPDCDGKFVEQPKGMMQTQMRRTGVQGKVPTLEELEDGGVGYNYADNKFFVRRGQEIHCYITSSVITYHESGKEEILHKTY